MNKRKSLLLDVLPLLVLGILLSGCSGSNQTSPVNANNVADISKEIAIDRLEIYHFHGTQQCYSCKTVGAYAEEAVKTYFSEEIKSGKMVFDHINIDLQENKELVMKYGAKSSSLLLGVYDQNGFHPEENVNVWYKINDKEDYMNYLKGLIEKRLMGDFS